MTNMHDPSSTTAATDDSKRLRETIIALHRSLLPQPLRHGPLLVDVRYLPYEDIGGDYCQVRFVDSDTCYITMCDVLGHGTAAALLATRVSSEVRHWLMQRCSPCDIVHRLNRFILDHFGRLDLFLSFVAVCIDLRRGRIRWSGAGHPSPVLLHREPARVELLPSQNILVGVQHACLHSEPEGAAAFNPGDRLVVYTDGLSETQNSAGRQLGTGGLVELAQHAMHETLFEMCDRILAGVDRHQHGPATDDRTLIVAELTHLVKD